LLSLASLHLDLIPLLHLHLLMLTISLLTLSSYYPLRFLAFLLHDLILFCQWVATIRIDPITRVGLYPNWLIKGSSLREVFGTWLFLCWGAGDSFLHPPLKRSMSWDYPLFQNIAKWDLPHQISTPRQSYHMHVKFEWLSWGVSQNLSCVVYTIFHTLHLLLPKPLSYHHLNHQIQILYFHLDLL
jgi:hypothetical protein